MLRWSSLLSRMAMPASSSTSLARRQLSSQGAESNPTASAARLAKVTSLFRGRPNGRSRVTAWGGMEGGWHRDEAALCDYWRARLWAAARCSRQQASKPDPTVAARQSTHGPTTAQRSEARTQDVAGVQVGVDEVVHDQHVQHGAGTQAGQLRVVRRTRAAAGRSRDTSQDAEAMI